MSSLTDDLVVEILSRLPLKSFCRFKCVCKSWCALSSDPHYRKKFPRNPIGMFYQIPEYRTDIHLARLPSSNKEIDTTLSFVPCYEDLQLMGCSNGLLLCYHGGIRTYFADISCWLWIARSKLHYTYVQASYIATKQTSCWMD
ncbi:hypothetical protein ZWY2020_018409 [Hordeum vulgare]|nr:hypothetical protein ZWY2020_018409 [Hordeum vulgare]